MALFYSCSLGKKIRIVTLHLIQTDCRLIAINTTTTTFLRREFWIENFPWIEFKPSVQTTSGDRMKGFCSPNASMWPNWTEHSFQFYAFLIVCDPNKNRLFFNFKKVFDCQIPLIRINKTNFILEDTFWMSAGLWGTIWLKHKLVRHSNLKLFIQNHCDCFKLIW